VAVVPQREVVFLRQEDASAAFTLAGQCAHAKTCDEPAAGASFSRKQPETGHDYDSILRPSLHLTNTWTLRLAKPPTPSAGSPISSQELNPTCASSGGRSKFGLRATPWVRGGVGGGGVFRETRQLVWAAGGDHTTHHQASKQPTGPS